MNGAKKIKKISEYQFAYKKGLGCHEAIFSLLSTLQLNISKRRNVFDLFMDLSQAFESYRTRHAVGKIDQDCFEQYIRKC